MSVFEKSEKRFDLPSETNYIIILVGVNFLRGILEPIPSKLRNTKTVWHSYIFMVYRIVFAFILDF